MPSFRRRHDRPHLPTKNRGNGRSSSGLKKPWLLSIVFIGIHLTCSLSSPLVLLHLHSKHEPVFLWDIKYLFESNVTPPFAQVSVYSSFVVNPSFILIHFLKQVAGLAQFSDWFLDIKQKNKPWDLLCLLRPPMCRSKVESGVRVYKSGECCRPDKAINKGVRSHVRPDSRPANWEMIITLWGLLCDWQSFSSGYNESFPQNNEHKRIVTLARA